MVEDESQDRKVETSQHDWYWDLNRKIAVRADNRGAYDHTLGPYDSKAEAENWKATSQRRNDIWAADDDEWNDVNSNHD